MPQPYRLRSFLTAALLLLLVLAACGIERQSGAQQGTSTVAITTTSQAETTATSAVTVAPTVIAAPTATAFPLKAGWWDDAVCYEVFVRSFYDSDGDGIGDLKGLTAKLDYLNDGDDSKTGDLGVNCLWLMPVADSPSYHGYDVVDYGKIEPDYGTNDDFKAFMAAAHQRGIKVIVDLVLNHTSREHPWFQEAIKDPASKYHDWYIWSEENPGYKGPWGQQVWYRATGGTNFYYAVFWDGMPDLDYRNPEVTQEAYAVSRFWIEEMGVDGFRLDAIRHLIEDSRTQQDTEATHAWLRDYYDFLRSLNRDLYTVGEVLVPSTKTIASYYPDQLDAFFEFQVAESIIKAADAGAALPFNTAVKNAMANLPFQRFAPLLTNHDQNRVMGVLDGEVDKAKIAATALLTIPGLPFMYYGEEIGMVGEKPDERIRTPMQWNGAAGGGFTTGKPWEAFQTDLAEVNVAAQDADAASLLNLYRKLIGLHRTHPALGHGSFIPLTASDGSVAAFVRHTADEDVLVVLNFGKAAKDGLKVSATTSELAAGTYQLEPLLNDTAGAPLVVGANGAVAEVVPVPSLAPRTGYIWKLTK